MGIKGFLVDDREYVSQYCHELSPYRDETFHMNWLWELIDGAWLVYRETGEQDDVFFGVVV